MAFIVVAFLIIAVTLAAFFVVPTLRPATPKSRLRALAIGAGVLLLAVVTALSSVHTISAGHTGQRFAIARHIARMQQVLPKAGIDHCGGALEASQTIEVLADIAGV